MKDFQSSGLFGARNVHKKILDIFYPRFDETDATHFKLAELSEKAHAKAKEYLEMNPPQEDLTPMRLGKLRLDIKRYLTDEMQAIDNLVEKIIK